MASAWTDSWGDSWGDSWAAGVAPPPQEQRPHGHGRYRYPKIIREPKKAKPETVPDIRQPEKPKVIRKIVTGGGKLTSPAAALSGSGVFVIPSREGGGLASVPVAMNGAGSFVVVRWEERMQQAERRLSQEILMAKMLGLPEEFICS